MIDLGVHWEFISAAYGGAVVVVFALIGWTALSSRRARKRVSELELARTARRAS